MNNADMPASGISLEFFDKKGSYNPYVIGLTKREHIATMLMANMAGSKTYSEHPWDAIAMEATKGADALLNELDK